MNINSIQKHYDRLTPPERFKLLNLAAQRGDAVELAALRSSAPKKKWSVTTTTGMVEAFRFLSMWHLLTMLELDGLYWVMLAIGDDEVKLSGDETYTSMMDNVRRRALARDAAWRAICLEYGLNPDETIADMPGAVGIAFFLRNLREWQEIAPVEYDTTQYINDLRAVIAEYRRQWE